MRWFLIKFLVLVVIIFVFHFQQDIYETLTNPWTELLARISSSIMLAFDDNIVVKGVEIYTTTKNSQNFSGIAIAAGCNGVEAWLVLVAAIISFPLKKDRYLSIVMAAVLVVATVLFFASSIAHIWLLAFVGAVYSVMLLRTKEGRYKFLGITLGFIAIQMLNVVRVISLFYLGKWNRDIFDFAHVYAWQALIILDAFVVFLIWLSRLPKIDGSDDTSLDEEQPLTESPDIDTVKP